MNDSQRLDVLFFEFLELSQNGKVPNFEKADYDALIQYCFSKKNYLGGKAVCEAARQLFPYSREFDLAYARALLFLDEPARALAFLEGIAFVGEHYEQAQLLKAKSLNAQGRFHEALDVLNNLDTTYRSADAASLLIAILEELREFDGLYEVTKRSILEGPADQAESLLRKLYFYATVTDEQDDAITFIRRYLDHRPFTPAAWLYLGLLYQEQTDYDRAIDALEYCIALDGSNKTAYIECGRCFELKKDYASALLYYREYLQNLGTPDPEMMIRLSDCLLQNSQYHQAIQILNEVLDLEALSAEANYILGKAFVATQRPDKSIVFFKRALLLNPDNEDYLLELAEAYYAAGQAEAARQTFEAAVECAPDIIDTWIAFISFLLETKDFDAVETALEELALYFDDTQVAYFKIAELFALKKRKHAIDYLKNALQDKSSDHAILFTLLPHLTHDNEIISMVLKHRQ